MPTEQQELQSQLDALAAAGCEPVFSEKISTRIKEQPEFTKAMDFARTIKAAVPHQRVIFTVPVMKRLGRGAAALFAFLAGMAESEREYIREKSLEGQASARERGRHGGRPKMFDDDMAAFGKEGAEHPHDAPLHRPPKLRRRTALTRQRLQRLGVQPEELLELGHDTSGRNRR
nr:recombinase family protein [Nonomuraea rhodomycinica]